MKIILHAGLIESTHKLCLLKSLSLSLPPSRRYATSNQINFHINHHEMMPTWKIKRECAFYSYLIPCHFTAIYPIVRPLTYTIHTRLIYLKWKQAWGMSSGNKILFFKNLTDDLKSKIISYPPVESSIYLLRIAFNFIADVSVKINKKFFLNLGEKTTLKFDFCYSYFSLRVKLINFSPEKLFS